MNSSLTRRSQKSLRHRSSNLFQEKTTLSPLFPCSSVPIQTTTRVNKFSGPTGWCSETFAESSRTIHLVGSYQKKKKSLLFFFCAWCTHTERIKNGFGQRMPLGRNVKVGKEKQKGGNYKLKSFAPGKGMRQWSFWRKKSESGRLINRLFGVLRWGLIIILSDEIWFSSRRSVEIIQRPRSELSKMAQEVFCKEEAKDNACHLQL